MTVVLPESGLLTTHQAERWRQLVMECTRWDVYYLPEYAALFEVPNAVEAFLFYYQEGARTLLYPFLCRALSAISHLGPEADGLHDAITPYGYGGPLVELADWTPEFVDRARAALKAKFARLGIVSELISFHPLLRNEQIWANDLDLRFRRNTIYVDLTIPEEQLWHQMDAKTRNMIRKSLKNDLEIDLSAQESHRVQFRTLYASTMERLGASASYRFSEEFFSQMFSSLKDNLVLCTVLYQGRPAASGVFLYNSNYLHYHLSGSAPELLKFAPNDRMLYAMINWGKERGVKAFHLGGGYQGNDSLFAFKAGYSKLQGDVYFGQAVHDRTAYDRLVRLRIERGDGSPAPGFFPAYRG